MDVATWFLMLASEESSKHFIEFLEMDTLGFIDFPIYRIKRETILKSIY